MKILLDTEKLSDMVKFLLTVHAKANGETIHAVHLANYLMNSHRKFDRQAFMVRAGIKEGSV